MQGPTIEIWWTLTVGTVVLLSLVMGLISSIVINQRRFIASQKEQLEQLRKSEEKYRNLFENSLVGMFRASLTEERILEANEALLRIVNTQSVDQLNDLVRDLVVPQVETIREFFSQQGYLEHYELKVPRKDGSTVWVSFSGKYSSSEGYIEGVVVDITGRKKAEERIREQAALLDKAQDAIMVIDLNNKVLFWNKSAERLYGWSAKEVPGKDVLDLIFKKDAKDTRPLLEEARRATLRGGEWNGELRCIRKSGVDITVSSRWTLVHGEDRVSTSILIVNTDVTEKKNLEAQFLRAQRMESIGVLAGGMAHDLNNVLTPILMSVQMIKKKLGDDGSHKLLATVEASAKRGADMVKQVLTFARGVHGERIPIQIRHIINEVHKICLETFPKSIDLKVDLPRDLWQIRGDATQLHQVLLNLAVNARDAMPKGGTLTIAAENTVVDDGFAKLNPETSEGPYVVISVSDTGIGIPESDQDKIFEPFYTTKDVGKGTGLGLSTALGIVKSHRGIIKLTSEEGNGTNFRIYMPADLEAEKTEVHEAHQEIPAGHGELILVVDDEKAVREVTTETLQSYGYRVIAAGDGTEALSLYTKWEQEIRAVVTDMMMPNMDGAATIKALHGMNPKLKIIATSGLTGMGGLGDFSSTGVQTMLMKPYTARQLLRIIHSVLESDHVV